MVTAPVGRVRRSLKESEMSKDQDDIQLDKFQAEAFARGLFALAHADGLHEREAALVASFWADTGGSAAALSELSRQSRISAADLASSLVTPEIRQLFMKTALLLMWADGAVSAEELAVIKDYSAALEVTGAAFEQIEAEVKDFLLSHLSHIQNVESVAQVAKKLAI